MIFADTAVVLAALPRRRPGEELAFATYDLRQAEAARAIKLRVFQP